jgi:zinc/manganese transport system permease protein
MFRYPFMVNAFWAGTFVALTAAAVGWFMVLRRQAFAGHTLAIIGFPGAAGAVLLGLSAHVGFYAFGAGGALLVAALPTRSRSAFGEESAVVGTLQALALACGFLFVSLDHGNATRMNALLFGTFLGITERQVVVLAVVGAVTLGLVACIARPLYFASVDPDVASARGVPVRWLSVASLVVLGVAAAATSQITGALLVFALLVLPAATAQRVTARPALGFGITVALGLLATWGGLTLGYYTSWPIGFSVTSISFGLYALAVWRC